MRLRPSAGILIIFFSVAGLQSQQSDPTLQKPATGVPSRADVDSTKELKSPRGAMLRSMALPGWGQFYNEKCFKGVLIAGTELGLITNAIIQNQLAQRASSEYDRLFYQDNRNLSFWWLAGVILFSMADAFVDAHLYHFDESPNLSAVRPGFNTAPQFEAQAIFIQLRIVL